MNNSPDSNKLISIIIPCHNCSETVYRTWKSVTNQSIGINHIECIFVDDASNDNGKTWEQLENIEKEAPKSVIIIKLNDNLKQGGARNVGLTYTNGKYLQFLDSDDELVPSSCELLYTTAEKNNADIIQFNHLYVLNEQTKIMRDSDINRTFTINKPEDRIPFLNSTIVTYGCTNKFYRKSLIEKSMAKFAENAVYEEPLFVYPCFLYANTITLLDEALYKYYFHSGSTVTSAIGKRLLDHPRVQLELLQYCMQRPVIYEQYRDVISLYFLWSYYCETLSFSAANNTYIPIDYFREMQNICRTLFPEWENNPLINTVSENVRQVLKSINDTYSSQNELNSFISTVKNII